MKKSQLLRLFPLMSLQVILFCCCLMTNVMVKGDGATEPTAGGGDAAADGGDAAADGGDAAADGGAAVDGGANGGNATDTDASGGDDAAGGADDEGVTGDPIDYDYQPAPIDPVNPVEPDVVQKASLDVKSLNYTKKCSAEVLLIGDDSVLFTFVVQDANESFVLTEDENAPMFSWEGPEGSNDNGECEMSFSACLLVGEAPPKDQCWCMSVGNGVYEANLRFLAVPALLQRTVSLTWKSKSEDFSDIVSTATVGFSHKIQKTCGAEPSAGKDKKAGKSGTSTSAVSKRLPDYCGIFVGIMAVTYLTGREIC